MSLFLGNLSSHIRRDELERVFRRFGQCSMQLKDGYGFAVYEFPRNAEKALRALRGKIICGEPIILSWSNMQPKPFQRFARGARSYEPRYRGNYARRQGFFGQRFESSGQDYKMGKKQVDSDDLRHNSDEILDEESNYHQNKLKDNVGDKRPDVAKDLVDESGRIEPNQVENDRWGQEVVEPSNENETGDGLEFDRYDPYPSHEKRDEEEKDHIISSGGSPSLGNSQDKTVKDRIVVANRNDLGNSISQHTCYICGESGHKMHNCRQYNASRGKRFTRFDRRQDDEVYFRGRGGYELERLRSTSRGRLPSGRDAIPMRRPKIGRKASGSGKRRWRMKSETEREEALRKNSRQENRSRKENGSPRRPHLKKARRSVSSPLHSDYPASRSRSHSRSSNSRSRSRSASFRSRSLHSNSRSRSMSSHYSRSKSSRTRSRSSSPTSLSLSVSLGQPLLSSPNKMQINRKDSFDNATTAESKGVLVNEGQSVEANTALKIPPKLEIATMVVENENAMSSFKVEADLGEVHPHHHNDNNIHAASNILDEGQHQSPALLEEGAFTGGSLSSQSIREENELDRSTVMAMEHIPTTELNPVHLSSCTRDLVVISSKEMSMVMKHYGLDSEENDLSADKYFGSARLWPWEIVYCRRLRKGPISVENYARRIAQNREFGIIDKYVRSSSGCGELGQGSS